MTYTSLDLKSVVVCDGSSLNAPGGSYINVAAFPTYAAESAKIEPFGCWGVSAGIVIGSGGFGIDIDATYVRCPGQSINVDLIEYPSKVYVDMSSAERTSAWNAYTVRSDRICVVGGNCRKFRSVGGQSQPMYMTHWGLSDNPVGTILQITPTGSNIVTPVVGGCDTSGVNCWAKGLARGDCPIVHQYPDMSTEDLITSSKAFDPSIESVVGTEFAASHPSYYVEAVGSCTGNQFSTLPSYIETLAGSSQQSASQVSCIDSAKADLPSCLPGRGIEVANSGKISDSQGVVGNKILFECPGTSQSKMLWQVASGSVPGPSQNGNITNCNNRSYEYMSCTRCGYVVSCYQTGRYVAPLVNGGHSGRITNTSWVYPPTKSGGLCALDVVAFGKNWIQLRAYNAPCVTTGDMGPMEFDSNETQKLNLYGNGLYRQLILNGTLYWYFENHYVKPTRHHVNGSTTVVTPPPTGGCTQQDCSCDEWDCSGGDLFCAFTPASSTTCKCYLIGKGDSIGCAVIDIFVNLIIYLVLLGIFLAIIKLIFNKCTEGKTVKRKSASTNSSYI